MADKEKEGTNPMNGENPKGQEPQKEQEPVKQKGKFGTKVKIGIGLGVTVLLTAGAWLLKGIFGKDDESTDESPSTPTTEG